MGPPAEPCHVRICALAFPDNPTLLQHRMELYFSSITPSITPSKWKLHLACESYDHPLNVFVRNRTEWDRWNAWRSNRDDFSRDFILAFIEFHPQSDTWLFGGAYRVVARSQENQSHSYTIENLPEWEPYVGRLKIKLKRPGRGKAFNLENHYGDLQVLELLPEVYSGEAFPGYDNINISFRELEDIYAVERPDWKSALENAEGVYVITDCSNGRRYIGSAYGITGLWSRWACYIATGHGFTDGLTKIIDEKGMDYARENFRLALLEHRTPKTDDNTLISRECYWKDVLLTRQLEFGYNRN